MIEEKIITLLTPSPSNSLKWFQSVNYGLVIEFKTGILQKLDFLNNFIRGWRRVSCTPLFQSRDCLRPKIKTPRTLMYLDPL